MLFLKNLYHTLLSASKWKYFKVLNRKPVNKAHLAIGIAYAILIALFNPYPLHDPMYTKTSLGGMFFIHFCLNYYFLIYKKEREQSGTDNSENQG